MGKRLEYLVYKNNWASHEYYWGGFRLTDIKRVSIRGKKYRVRSFWDCVLYNDMGQTYEAKSTQFEIELKADLGLKLPITLNDLISKKMKITPLEFSCDPETKTNSR